MPDNREEPGSVGRKGEADTIDGAANEAAGKATQKLGKQTDDLIERKTISPPAHATASPAQG